MDRYLVLLVINAVFYRQVVGILAGDDCHSHWRCKGSSSSSYCCRDYSANSGRSCLNVSSCLGRFCTSNYECVRPGVGECCWSNKCTNCSFCVENSDCGTGQYCCNSRSNGSKCSSTCVGETCNHDADCGAPDECCRQGQCVKCSDPGCFRHYDCASGEYCCVQNINDRVKPNYCNASCIGKSCDYHDECGGPVECCWSNKCTNCSFCVDNSDCGTGQYCCNSRINGSKCSSTCVRETCDRHADCGAPHECCRRGKCVNVNSCEYHGDCDEPDECCQSNKCVKCPYTVCHRSRDCSTGQYCCGREPKGICRESCLGESCAVDEQCSSPDCCGDGFCTSVGCLCYNTHQHCTDGAYCCLWPAGIGQCNTTCIGLPCSSHSGCGGMALGEWCRDGVCVRDQCDSHFYCDIKEYPCCQTTLQNKLSECKAQCISESCSSNSTCSNDLVCCGTFSSWLILAIVVSSLVFVFGIVTFAIKYCRNKGKHDVGTFQARSQDDKIVPYTIF